MTRPEQPVRMADKGGIMMKKYIMPIIDILMFDDEDKVCTILSGTYSAHQLNKVIYEDEEAKATKTIKLQEILVRQQ